MNECSDDESLVNIFTNNPGNEDNTIGEEYCASVYETGFNKPLINLKLSDREELEHILKNYFCIIRVKAAMDQFIEGLQSLEIHSYIKKYPKMMECYFIDDVKLRRITPCESQ